MARDGYGLPLFGGAGAYSAVDADHGGGRCRTESITPTRPSSATCRYWNDA